MKFAAFRRTLAAVAGTALVSSALPAATSPIRRSEHVPEVLKQPRAASTRTLLPRSCYCTPRGESVPAGASRPELRFSSALQHPATPSSGSRPPVPRAPDPTRRRAGPFRAREVAEAVRFGVA